MSVSGPGCRSEHGSHGPGACVAATHAPFQHILAEVVAGRDVRPGPELAIQLLRQHGLARFSEAVLLAWLRKILVRNLANLITYHRAGRRDARRQRPPRSLVKAGVSARTHRRMALA